MPASMGMINVNFGCCDDSRAWIGGCAHADDDDDDDDAIMMVMLVIMMILMPMMVMMMI